MSTIQSVERAFQILQAVAQFPNEAQLGDVAEATSLPKSTVSRMLTTLGEIGAIQQAHPGAGYKIGRIISDLITQPSWLVNLAEPWLKKLVEQTGETATLSVMDGDRLLYVAQHSDPNNNIQLRDWTGIHFPNLHTSSPSKLFLAYDPILQKNYLARPLQTFTENTISDPTELAIHLKKVKTQGYAWVREEFERGLAGVSAPIFDQNEKIVAAVSLYGPIFRIPPAGSDAEFTALVTTVASEITSHLRG